MFFFLVQRAVFLIDHTRTHQTSSLLTFVIYLLSTNPDTCRRLREEVIETFGLTGTPSYEHLKTMDYRALVAFLAANRSDISHTSSTRHTVHAVLKETLRLFPSAPLVARTSLDEPLVIQSSHNKLYLPPKTQIMMSSLLTHKRPDLWGADAEVFRPERWLEAALLDKVASTPFMYSPFYGGPRVVRAAPSLCLAFFDWWENSVLDRHSRLTKRRISSCASYSDSAHSRSLRNICLPDRYPLRIGRVCRVGRAWRRYILRLI